MKYIIKLPVNNTQHKCGDETAVPGVMAQMLRALPALLEDPQGAGHSLL